MRGFINFALLYLVFALLRVSLLLIYVNNIVITGSDIAFLTQLQQHLKASFHMKDHGPLQYFFSLEVQFTLTGTLLHQHKYTEEVILLAGLQLGNFILTLLKVNLKIRQEKDDLLSDPSLYWQVVESLNYLMITRPDISFVVQQINQFMQAPRNLHLVVVCRIIRYLKGTSTRGLLFDWAGYVNTRHSVTS
jgi:hypothetical protein